MTTIFNINEFTAPWFLVMALFRRMPYVLAVEAIFPPLQSVLNTLVERVVEKGRARWIFDLCPEQEFLRVYPVRTFLYDVFGQTEEWHNAHYGLKGVDEKIPEYAMAYKQGTCNHARLKHYHILLLGAALKNHPDKNIRVAGLPEDTVELMEAYWGRALTSGLKAMPIPRWPFNVVTTFLIQVFSLIWVVSRTRPTLSAPEEIFFAADYLEDQRDFRTYQEVAEGGPILLVNRNSALFKITPHDELKGYNNCGPKDGLFSPRGALAAMAMVIRDSVRLFYHFNKVQPALFYRVATLPFRRAVLRAFFNRYHPKYYWGRDDYNPEHILRHQELKRIGGISLGINHGYATYTTVMPGWRYISFDRYYVFGRAVYESAMKDTWNADMTIVPVGTFGARREDYARRLDSKPTDIIVYSGVFVGDQRMADFVRGLAMAFPERTVFLQIKRILADTPAGDEYIETCTKNLGNVQLTEAPLFDLVTRARYAFSDPSSVVVESIQFGQMSFFADLMPEQKTCIYRDFPEICVSSAEDATARIRAIEAGDETYPIENLDSLIDLSGRVFFDVLREDLGLSAKEPARPLPMVRA